MRCLKQFIPWRIGGEHWGIVALLLLSGCVAGDTGDFEASIDPALTPAQSSVPDAAGNPQPVAASRDAQGVQSDFVERLILVRPASDAELQEFLRRYNGRVVSDNTIPVPPLELGITLTNEQRRPTEFVVEVDLGTVDLDGLAADARSQGLDEPLVFSSEAGLRTFARVMDAREAGFEASFEHVTQSQQAFPQAMFASVERTATNAFSDQRYGTTSNQTNLALAWQFLLAHGIQQRIQVAIIDSGFWLDTQGRARGADSDFVPSPAVPPQFDFVQNDRIADGPNPNPCAATNPCFWHGTGAAGAATGIMNNSLGHAGTGSLIATPILLKKNNTRSNRNWAVRTAVAWGAHVISMSFGGDCNQACRIYDRDHTPFADAVNAGSRTVFVAAAGNGRGNPAAGYDVGDPSFVHPCIEDHVICVGAVQETPAALTPTAFSNFGARVTIFAPTNLTVMSYPQSVDGFGAPLPIAQATGVEVPQTFGGTSASTPFVAGVAAMMKAINPNLNSDDVSRILVETARPAIAPATRVIDAFAAVRKAAEGIPMVNDRFENNSLESNPTNLSATPPHSQPNLNINNGDRDYFTFNAPGGSTATINLSHVEALGPISVFAFDSLGPHCAAPTLISDVPLPTADPLAPGHRLTYLVPGGPLRLALKGTDINAYNLNIAFTNRAIAPDFYEVNDQVAQARYIRSWKLHQGPIPYIGSDPRIAINANIHVPTDVDYYIVRGARVTVPEQVFFVGYGAVRVYGNESPLSLQVFRLNADDTQGFQVANVGGGSCVAEPLEVRLDADAYYLVRVSGSTGNYTLSNGVFGDKRRFPVLVRDQIYEVLHPGEPIEQVIRKPEIYVFAADPTYSAVRTSDPRTTMRLLDRDGNAIKESMSDEMGERLSLVDAADGIYGIAVAPQGTAEQPPTLALRWEQRPPTRVSDNLVRNPGAEIVGSGLSDWQSDGDMLAARALAYGTGENQPSPADPGPNDRGTYLFAGASDGRMSGVQQEIAIAPAWRDAIDHNRVKVNFSAHLGGYLREGDVAAATLTFVGEDRQELGSILLPSVGLHERSGKTGLWAVSESERVPRGTTALILKLLFVRVYGNSNDSYADNVWVSFSEF